MPATASASSRAAAAAQKIRLHHYAALLITELALVLIFPFFVGTTFREGLFRALSSAVFSAALYAILGRGRVTVISFALGIPAIAILILNVLGFEERWHTFGLVLGFAFLSYMSVVLVWTILSEASVTTDSLAGAVSAYMLIGITFGVGYAMIERVIPGAFRDTVEPAKHLTQTELTFFSFVTLTSVGYGDIVPREAHARAVCIIEAVIGIMYPAVLVGRLVGLHGQKRDRD